LPKPIAANDNNPDFYVYAWLRPDGKPFYIGKGRRGRDRSEKTNNSLFMRTLAKLRRSGHEPVVVRLHECLDEKEAHRLECLEIAKYGRRNIGTGILTNLTDGGEGVAGWVPSEETRAKLRLAHTGKVLSPEHRAKVLHIVSNRSAETRAKMSASQKGRKHTEATLALMRENNAMKNPEHRAKVSAALTGRLVSEEWRSNMSAYANNRPDSHNAKIGVNNRMRPPASGYKGVSFNKATGRWKVAIRIGDKRPFRGYFAVPEDAARAYDKAAIAAWGEGGCYVNFPVAANDNTSIGAPWPEAPIVSSTTPLGGQG
jgi:hypothetical protein